jgi:ArsR family transcriptional regulator, arsenate/arsenite/antimonite-responsive transcriptional repressor
MYGLVKAIKALSEDTRLRMINLLLLRECCVCEVMQALNISQTRASRNLSLLYDAGFLKMRKEGLWSLYSIDKKGMPAHLIGLIEAIRLALAENQVAQKDRERLTTASRSVANCLKLTQGAQPKGMAA